MTVDYHEGDGWELSPDAPALEALDLLEWGGEPDLVGAAVRAVQAALPEWVPRAGNTEMALLEGIAVMLAPDVLALQSVHTRVVEQIAGLHGVSRAVGSPARGTAVVTVTGSAPVQTIPVGTILRAELTATGEVVDLETTSAAEVITSETRDAVVQVETMDLGEAGNGLPPGTTLEVLSMLPHVERAYLSSALTGGRGPETFEHFMSRAATVLSRQTSVLVLPEHFQAAALEHDGVIRARVLDLTDPARPGVEAAGHVTVAAAGHDGQPLAHEDADALAVSLSSRALASLSVHVVPPTVTDVPVTVTVKPAPTADRDALEGDVGNALAAWLDPDAWDWSSEVTAFGIVGVVSSVPGVAAVVSVGQGPVSLPGAAPLTRPGTIRVVVAP